MKRQVSAGGVVFIRDGEVKMLLIKDHNSKWALPKGLVEKSESNEEAALREVNEETGLTGIRIIKYAGEISYFFVFEGEKIFKTVYFFLIESKTKETKPEREIKDAQWFSPKESLEKIGYKNTKEILENAIKMLENLK